MNVSSNFRLLGFSLVISLITCAVYWSGLSGSFVFDDIENIVANNALQIFDGSLASLIEASVTGTSSPLGRPLSVASFALNLYAFGPSPFSFKLINLLIHLANGMLVFVLVRQLWVPELCNTNKNRATTPAMWVATVWLLHPINLTPVLFVVQRMTSLATLFTLAALCLYLYGRKVGGIKAWCAISASVLVCWPAAIFSKEIGVLLPIFILLCEWLALGGISSIPPRIRWFVTLIFSFAVIGAMISKWDIVTGGYAARDFGLIERLMTEARVLWFYLLQLFLPWPDLFSLHHDDFTISRGIYSPPQTLLAIIGWCLLIALALYRRRRSPLFTFAVAWFLGAHALESTILPLEIAYEHRNYLASLGIWIWMAALLFTPGQYRQSKVPRLVLAGSFAFFCGFVTMLRAEQWSDEYRHTQLEAATHPNSARTNYNAALVILQRTFEAGGGNSVAYHMAQFHFARAAELDRSSKAPLIGLIYLDCLSGSKKNITLQVKLRERFAKAPLRPADLGVVQSLSGLLVERKLCMEDAEVKALLDAALSNREATGLMRGTIYAVSMDYAVARMGALSLGLHYAKAAVDSAPNTIPFRINLIRLLLSMGEIRDAQKEYASLAKLNVTLRNKLDIEQLGKQLEKSAQNAASY